MFIAVCNGIYYKRKSKTEHRLSVTVVGGVD